MDDLRRSKIALAIASAVIVSTAAFLFCYRDSCIAADPSTQNPGPLPKTVVCPLDADQKDLTIWPNAQSSGNSDPWMIANHDKLKKIKPRVLVLNFANSMDMTKAKAMTEKFIASIAESTRYHGYADAQAPAFVEYQVAKYVDIRDDPIPESARAANSSLAPYLKDAKQVSEFGACDYSAFYSDDFAKRYGYEDPKKPGRFLNLHELINAGIIHELWFFWIHDKKGAPYEAIEYKWYYDDNCKPTGKCGPSGNGHSPTMPWSGRSFRINFINPDRGIGCALENLSHAMEHMGHYNSVGYFKKYFYDFAEFNLDKKYSAPFNSFYAVKFAKDGKIEYPTETSFVVKHDGKEVKIDPYNSVAGNVHFPPGGRCHYDLKSPFTVKSTIENYRLFNGEGGKKDLAEDFNSQKFQRYNELCPDGMGPWLIYWRQSMPGLDNKCRDDAGKPMKNWWVFLFY